MSSSHSSKDGRFLYTCAKAPKTGAKRDQSSLIPLMQIDQDQPNVYQFFAVFLKNTPLFI
ncbi:hypothetical protein D8W73_00020 [Citrobacter amalonaticus]|nr:hypothetical protein [Citrobacter amalonaticus]